MCLEYLHPRQASYNSTLSVSTPLVYIGIKVRAHSIRPRWPFMGAISLQTLSFHLIYKDLKQVIPHIVVLG